MSVTFLKGAKTSVSERGLEFHVMWDIPWTWVYATFRSAQALNQSKGSQPMTERFLRAYRCS